MLLRCWGCILIDSDRPSVDALIEIADERPALHALMA
jgi:hypothetical protein